MATRFDRLGQFKHLSAGATCRCLYNVKTMVYTPDPGQFSATAERGLVIKKQGTNPYLPVDICMEAIVANATFVARSFAGDPKQVKELIKAAFSHNGIAIIDIISPCVSFHNQDESLHSYSFGKEHETPLHDLTYIPAREEITVEDFEEGTTREITLHDGSMVMLKKWTAITTRPTSGAFACL